MSERSNGSPFGSLAEIMDPKLRLLDPFPAYRRRRETTPVYYDAKMETWSVFRFADVERVLSEYATFSSRFELSERARRRRRKADEPGAGIPATIISTDPPRHHQLRGLVSKAFNPKATALWAPRIEQIARELLDKVARSGRMDVVRDFSVPLPITVIAEMLGVDAADLDRFKRWSDDLLSSSNTQDLDGPRQVSESEREMRTYFKESIAEHRGKGKSDLIGRLIEAEIEGEHLTEEELLNFCILLLIAGNLTTTNLIANAMVCFDRYGDVMAELRHQPALLPSAIEEILRYLSPVQAMFRVVAAETSIGGQVLRPGEMVMAWIGAANRDGAEFADPERFDIRRDPNRHIGFGKGIHYCLGAHLARLEAQIALRALLERFQGIRIVPGTTLQPVDSAFLLAPKSVPIEFHSIAVHGASQGGYGEGHADRAAGQVVEVGGVLPSEAGV